MPARWPALPAMTSGRRRALIGFGAFVAVAVWLAIVALAAPFDWTQPGTGHDARPYWTALFDHPYATSGVGQHDAYLYSPAFLELLAPLRALPWQLFVAGWTAVLLLATLYLVGPVLLGPAILLALPELYGGNVSLLLAVGIVAGFRFSGAWTFALLTKVTPILGLLWFAVRREWRALVIAGTTSVGVIILSFLFAPPAEWLEWLRVLTANAGAPIGSGSFPVPLLVRLPVAAVVIAWAAHTDRRWAVPIGCLLALPVIWYGSLSLLLAIVPLAFPRWTAWDWHAPLARGRSWLHGRRRVGGTQSA